MTRAFLATLLLVAACDAPADTLDDERSASVSAPRRTNGDPCWDAPEHPGITLTSAEVAVADLCISELPDVDGCWIALGDAPGTVEIWCDFACGETVDTIAAYPGVGQVRIELQSPC